MIPPNRRRFYRTINNCQEKILRKMFTFGKKKNRSRNFESKKKYFLLFFIFLNVNIFRGIFFLAVVDCSVKSPPVRGNRVFKEFLQYQTLLGAQLVALGNTSSTTCCQVSCRERFGALRPYKQPIWITYCHFFCCKMEFG